MMTIPNVTTATHSPDLEFCTRPRRILIAEDNQGVLKLLLASFEQAGFECLAAHDGGEAMRMVLEASYDLLLTGHEMPMTCGVELVAQLRTCSWRIPVIVFTDFLPGSSVQQYALLGVEHLVPKSCPAGDLVMLARELLWEADGSAGGWNCTKDSSSCATF